MEELQKVLELSLQALEEEKNAYLQIDTDLKSLMNLPHKNSKVSQSSRLVCIGCDLWVEMTSTEATSYFNRRIEANQTSLRQLTEKIQQSRSILENIQTLLTQPSEKDATEESNADALPIIDIQETLDDDGEVVSVTLNDKAVDLSQKQTEESKESKNATISSNTSDTIETTDYPKPVDEPEAETSDDDQIEELLADMEIVQRPISTEVTKTSDEKKETTTSNDVDHDYDSEDDDICPAIRPEDVYELELIASELAPEDDEAEFIDDEEFEFELEDDDYDIDNEDDDDDDESDSKADELLYGGNFGMFKGKTDLQNRLWGEVQALRNKKLLEQEPKVEDRSNGKVKSKLVRFSESTEVKEIEDVSESLKTIEHKKQKPLRFRERLIMSGKSEIRGIKTQKSIDSDQVTTDIVDRSDIS